MSDLIGVLVEGMLNGLCLGSMYILAGLGFCLLYGVFRVLQFAHGELVMLSGFFAWILMTHYKLNYFLAILFSVLFSIVIGVIIESSVFKPLRSSRGLSPGITAEALRVGVAAIALQGLFQHSALLIWGPEARGFSTPMAKVLLNVAGINFSLQKLVIFVVALIVILATVYVINETRLGKAIRAVSQDGEASRLMGINDRWIGVAVFALACGTAGVAGALLVPLISVHVFTGGMVLFKAFIIVVLAGFNIGGVIYVGLALGILENFIVIFFPPEWMNSIAFVIMIGLMFWRPTGLFPEKVAENI
jgi:branched-chain amino acid transport system permease protein